MWVPSRKRDLRACPGTVRSSRAAFVPGGQGHGEFGASTLHKPHLMNGASALQKQEHVFGHGHTRPEACKREATRSRECNAQRRPGLGNHPPVMCRLVDQQDHGVDRPIALLQVETSKECLEVVQASLGLDPEPPVGPLDDEVPCSLVVPAGGVAPAAAGVPVAADCNRYDGDFVAQDQGWRKQSRESSLKGEP